jgi:hypothetical protein
MLLAIKDAADEGIDGSPLIALGFVVAYQLEVHNSLYGRVTDPVRMYFCVNMPFGRRVLRNFVLGDLP